MDSKNLQHLKSILSNNQNNKFIKELLSSILKNKVKDIKLDEIKEFDKISEYKFCIMKTKVTLENNEVLDIYLKLIKKGKIKQSLFCYWSLLYENETKGNNLAKNNLNSNKVAISEFKEEKYKNSVFLEIENNNTELLKYGTDVHFVDIKKYIQSKEIKYNSDNIKHIEIDNDLLFIGVIKKNI